MNNYEISSMTLALLPIGLNKTKIIEENSKELLFNKPFMSIIDYNCKINGSTYHGRYQSSKLLVGKKEKLPIIIEEKNNIIFLPTKSYRSDKCCWIAYNKIKDYYKSKNKTIIIFKNNEKLEIDISINMFETQLLKVLKLNLKMNSKKVQ